MFWDLARVGSRPTGTSSHSVVDSRCQQRGHTHTVEWGDGFGRWRAGPTGLAERRPPIPDVPEHDHGGTIEDGDSMIGRIVES